MGERTYQGCTVILSILLVITSSIGFWSIVNPQVEYIIIAEEQSLDCVYPPPDVDLPEMHLEIRELIFDNLASDVNGVLLLNGGFVTNRYDTDVEQVFRQESNFLYVTGYDQPNATVILDTASRKTILFIENHPEDYAVWNGNIESPAQISDEYLISEVYFREEIPSILASLQSSNPTDFTVYVMDKFVEFPSMSDYTVDTTYLEELIYGRREVKTDSELMLMRYAASVSSGAHEIVMNHTRPGTYEYNVEGTFLDGCFACGLTIQAYIPICASGNNSAILHYVANDRLMQNGDFLLIDAGAEYNGYGTDITRTYPVNGTFTADQAEVYQMVLDIQYRVIQRVAPGLSWGALQGYAEEYTCEMLINNDYIYSSVSDCLSLRLFRYFFPHGVSHYIGLDVHDRSDNFSIQLNERNVITVEPGIYFNAALLEPILDDPQLRTYFNSEKIQSLLDIEFGGVRIEDVVIVWSTGPEVISFPPKTIFAIDNQMN